MEQGTVHRVNERSGRFVVSCDDGDFAVFELVSWQPLHPGQRVSWLNRDTGRTKLEILDPPNALHVYALNWDCTEQRALQHIA